MTKCLTVDPAKRMTVEQTLAHPWLSQEAKKTGPEVDLLPNVKDNIKSRRTRECHAFMGFRKKETTSEGSGG